VSGVDSGDEPRLVAVCGLPGVGKSTVAEYMTDKLDAKRLRTDVVRQDLFDDPEYTSEERHAVYEELYERSRELLEDGAAVVLDATFAEKRHRDAVAAVARDCAVEYLLVKVVCERSIVERRIVARDDISDADLDVYQWFRDEFDPIETDHVTIDNSESKAKTRKQVEALF
jgi:predicted kinase